MYDEQKFTIAEKMVELDEISKSNTTLSEQEDVKNMLINARTILDGKYDSSNYDIQKSQIDQCLNSLNNMIIKFKGRNK